MTPKEKTEAVISNDFEILNGHPLKHILLQLDRFDDANFIRFDDGDIDYILISDSDDFEDGEYVNLNNLKG